MASKHPQKDDEATASPASDASTAHNIWLAGLGALAQAQASAQAEGSKAFEALVHQGLEMQARTQALAKEQWDEAAQRLNALTTHASENSWDRLGGIFQSRVARALSSLGMPPAGDLKALEERVAKLEAEVKRLRAASGKGAKSETGGKGRKAS